MAMPPFFESFQKLVESNWLIFLILYLRFILRSLIHYLTRSLPYMARWCSASR